jgi:hypothetical protein
MKTEAQKRADAKYKLKRVGKYTNLNLSIPVELKDEIKILSKEEGVTMLDFIKKLIFNYRKEV